MEVTGGLVYAKSLWTVISGTHWRATCEVVKHELDKATDLFSKGLTSFRPPNNESDKQLENKFAPQAYKFVINLRKFLGIDALQAWDLLSNYLLYEFQGAEVGLQAFLVSDEKTNMLMTDIWMFYHSERLFLLKCINLVLTYCKDPDHPYQKTLLDFIAQFSAKDFSSSLLTQLHTVTNEPYPHRDVHGQLMTDQYQLRWQNYNLREQIEVLHNMIVYVNMNSVDPSALHEIIKICVDCRFGKQEEYKVRNTALAKYYGDIIGYLQNIILLQHLNYVAGQVLSSKETPPNIDDDITSLGDQEEHAPSIMSWVLIKSFESYGDSSSMVFEKLGELAQTSGTFEYLRKLVSCDMFQDDNKLSDIVFKTVYDFVNLFVYNFEVDAFYHIKGLRHLVGPLLKHKRVIEQFWSSDKGIKSLLLVLSEQFPADYLPFIETVDSLAKYGPNHINELVKLLTNTKSFAEILDASAEDNMVACGTGEWKSTVSFRPLRYSSFTIPVGTKGRFIDEDTRLFCWKCDFVVFEAIYNEMRKIVEQISSVEHYVNVKTQDNVIASLKFIKSYLSSGVELTPEAVGVVNYVLTIISKLKSVFCVSTLVLALCLDIMVTLLPKFPEEILRRLRLLDVLPTIQMVPKNFIYIFDGEYFTPKTIGSIIQREECVCGEYPLLTSYLSFIYKLITSGSNVEVSVKTNVNVILPGVVFILADVYPNYQSWHFVDEKEHDDIAITCVKIFHEILSVTGSSNGSPAGVTTPLQLVQNLVLYSFLNMKAGKVLLKIVSAGEAYIQTKMEKKMNWVSVHGLSTVYLLQLNLSILNRVLLLKSQVHDKNILCTLESDIYCSPKENLQVIPIVASYINNSFSPILPVLAVKVLRRFALDMPKTLLACLGMESDVLRDMIFRRLNSRIDSNRLKVALLQLVSACVDTQPGMCDAFFNLPTEVMGSSSNNTQNAKQSKPEFLKRAPVKDNTKGGCLVFVCVILAKVQKEPDLVSLPLYGAAVDLICSLWLGENSAAVEYLRNKEKFWDLFCAPLFSKPQQYVYAFTQLFNIINLEIFHYGKSVHKDLLSNMEKFFDEKSSSFCDWANFVSDMFVQSNPDENMEEPRVLDSNLENYIWDPNTFSEEDKKLPSQQMEKQPPNVQLLISWKRFVITSMKLLPFKIGSDQKVVLTRSIMNALQHEIQHMSLKPILLLVELYLVLITDWHKQFFKDKEVVKDQIKLMLKSCATTYQPLPRRVREAVLALALRAVDCLAEEIQKDEVAAEIMLQATTEIVLLELSDMGISSQKSKLKPENDDEKPSDISLLLMHSLMPGTNIKYESTSMLRESLSGRLALSLLHKLLKILLGNTTWLQNFQLAEIRSAILRGLGRTLNQLHQQMNMFHFSVALNATNLIFFMFQNNIVDNSLDHQLPDNLWLQLIPPKCENKHWLSTGWPYLYKPSLEIITQHLQSRSFLFLESAISFVAMHDEYLVDAMLSFRHSLDVNMLELSMLALNLVRTVSYYPNHWKLCHESSLTNIITGVVTCLYMSVALLVNSVMLKALLEKPEKKVEQKSLLGVTDSEPSAQIITIHNHLLKLAYLCLSILQSYSPRLVYLLTECVQSPIASRPLVDTNLDAPVFDYDALTPLTFGTLITLANLCTQALSKGARVPSPRPAVSRPGIGTSLILSMDKNLSSSVFEITVEMITSQGLVYLLGDSLSSTDKELLQRSLNAEMTFFIEFSKRSLREGISSYTLDSTLQALKMYLATSMNLPLMRKVPIDKSHSQQTKVRKYASTRDSYSRSPSTTPSKMQKDNSFGFSSPQKGGSALKNSSQIQLHSQIRSNGSKEKTPTDSPQCDFQLPLNEDFVKLVAYVFSSIFDVFNTMT